MSVEILHKIEQAEEKAAEIQHQAVQQVREMGKAVDEALAAAAREGARETRQKVQAVLDAGRAQAQGEMDTLKKQSAQQREVLRAEGLGRVDAAAGYILDSVLKGS